MSIRGEHTGQQCGANRRVYTVLVVMLLLTPGTGMAQLLINEVCSKNHMILMGDPGQYPDWIELHNTGPEVIDLGHYHLSDRIQNLGKWQLPDIALAPGDHVVFLSGDTANGIMYFPFGISSAGETVFLSDADLNVVHSMAVPALQSDHSYGRLGTDLRYFALPTPGAPNSSMGFLGYAAKPTPSLSPGHHTEGEILTLSAMPGEEIHMTLDNTVPNEDSPHYLGGLGLNTTMVIRAFALAPDLLPSAVFTGTYLIGARRELPTFSITTHPDSLFHDTLGIYDTGPFAQEEFPFYGANYWSNKQIPAYVEFIDENGALGLSQQVDLRIHGGTQARTRPQRPLRLTARKRYGDDRLRHPFFPERGQLDEFKHVVLRNSGGDFARSQFRDGFWHQLSLHHGLNIDVLAFRPVQLFLNGQYWGVMNLRERISSQHLTHIHGADLSDPLIMEDENIPVLGDSMVFAELNAYILQHDLNDPAHWAHVESQLDIPSYKDYFALEIFAGNSDWPANNVRYWKPSPGTGKWRYLLHDLDATMIPAPWVPVNFDTFWWVLVHREGFLHSEIFRALLGNEEFKRTFINRLADLMNTTFTPSSMLDEQDVIRATIGPEMPYHFGRWDLNIAEWHHHAGTLLPEFAVSRAGHVHQHVLQTFDLPALTDLRFEVFPEGAGSLRINSITPGTPFQGVYFQGNPIDLTVEAAPGFELDHWQYSADEDFRPTTAHLRHDFSGSGTITAYLKPPGEALVAFPNPCVDMVQLSVASDEAGPADLMVFDARGTLLRSEGALLVQGVNRLDLEMSVYGAGVYVVRILTADRNFSTRIVKVTP